MSTEAWKKKAELPMPYITSFLVCLSNVASFTYLAVCTGNMSVKNVSQTNKTNNKKLSYFVFPFQLRYYLTSGSKNKSEMVLKFDSKGFKNVRVLPLDFGTKIVSGNLLKQK